MTTINTTQLRQLMAKNHNAPWKSIGIYISPLMDDTGFEPPSLKTSTAAALIVAMRNALPDLLAAYDRVGELEADILRKDKRNDDLRDQVVEVTRERDEDRSYYRTLLNRLENAQASARLHEQNHRTFKERYVKAMDNLAESCARVVELEAELKCSTDCRNSATENISTAWNERDAANERAERWKALAGEWFKWGDGSTIRYKYADLLSAESAKPKD